MKILMYKLSLPVVIIFCGVLLLNSCKKNTADSVLSVTPQQYFENNMVSQDLLVALAKDNNDDITARFGGYTFRLTVSAKLSGTITAANNLFSVNGTWNIDSAYNNITFVFPLNNISALSFMNKQWKFADRSSSAIKLTAVNRETDILNFVKK